MKIRRLEIIGFKSFIERTKLRFDDCVTGIVGPNGCGKSNIVDAIRWVMGEQNPRSLRAKIMEDVIFAGSESRPPLGMAEVLITFENDGRNVPPEYAAYPEITAGRRLFRSGESEYSINRTPCRLLDVQDLFMGTGVGTRAYSIIGQGQVGLLVSQKPQERRALIEEAAGISKYKARKKIAERKMEQTQQNLLRVNDVVVEIKRNIDSLQRQARKAARYHKLRDQLREIELHVASHKFLELQALQRYLRQQQQQLSTEQTAQQSLQARLEASLEERRTKLLDDDRVLATRQEAFFATDNQVNLNEKNIEFLTKELDAQGERSKQSAMEIEDLRAKLAGLANDVAMAQEVFATQQELAASAEGRLREREQDLQSQGHKVNQLTADIEQERQELATLGEEAAGHKSRLIHLDQRLIDLEGRCAQAEGERAAVQQRLAETQQRKQSQSETLNHVRQTHQSLVERREVQENSLGELQAQLTMVEAKSLSLRDEVGNRRSRLESLQELERNYAGCLSGVRWVMKNARGEEDQAAVVGLVADILQAPSRYETAVQAVLGDRLQSVVVRSQEIGFASVDYLKKAAEGRSSFIPLSLREADEPDISTVRGPGVIGPLQGLISYDSQYDNVLHYLMGDVVVVEDLPSALAVWQANGHKATLVTLEGDVLEPQGVLTGGSLEGPATHLLENKREIRELQDALQDLDAESVITKELCGQLKARVAQLTTEIGTLMQNSHDEELRIVDHQKDLNHITDQVGGFSARLEELGYSCQKLRHEIESVQYDQQRCREMLAKTAVRQHELEGTIRTCRGALDEEKRCQALLNQDVMELKIQHAQSREKLEAAGQSLEHLSGTRTDLEQRIEKLRADVIACNLQSRQAKERIEESRREISRLLTQREQQQSELSQLRSAYEQLLAEVHADEGQLKELRHNLEKLTSELNEAILRLHEIELECKHLQEDVARRNKCEIESCLLSYHLVPPPSPDTLARADKLRVEIERLGDVNPNAVEAYEELLKRYEFLNTQSQDLNDSLQKLQKVIQKINRTSRTRFSEAFEAINAKFQEVFPRLFNGGKAYLTLEEAEDVLEAGVNIVSQPPGKKLQSIELLSGGEKALTAVALLFSVFLIKPTPFCLLDEVDAPLDDVNIDRFNTMVREMSVGSQFILITHSKRTMEMLDRLYGITMEEPGISTVVTVQLKTQEEPSRQMAS